MSITPALLLNALLFQLGWWVCVLGGDGIAIAFVAGALLLYWRYARPDRAEWLCIALSAGIGCLLDSSLHAFGVLRFAETATFSIPLWLVALWLLFATTLNQSLRWLQARSLLAALLGAGAGPLSYWGGAQLGAAQFGIAAPVACLVLAVCWGLLLPLLNAMMRRRRRVLLLCMSLLNKLSLKQR